MTISKTKYTSQELDNMSFDDTYGVKVDLPLEEDPSGAVKRKITSNLSVRIYKDGTDVYVAEATPGALTANAVWRMQKIDTNGNVTWADGNTEFDNEADNYLTLSYS